MILTVMEPIIKLNFEEVTAELKRITNIQEEQQDELARQSMDAADKIISEEYRAYILERAAELGITCDVSVICETTAEGILIPVRISVTEVAQKEATALLRVIERDFGITAELPDAGA